MASLLLLFVTACGQHDHDAVSARAQAVTSTNLTIANPNPVNSGLFGSTVVPLGNDLLVGAPRNDSNNGAVYLIDGDTGAVKKTILNPQPGAGDRFGASIAVFADGRFAVGAPLDNPVIGGTSFTDAGSVYVFNADFTLAKSIPFPNAATGGTEQFGTSLAVLDANTLVVGVPFDDDGGTIGNNSGSVWLINPNTGGNIQRIDNPFPGPTNGDQFGQAVAVLGGNIYVGAPFDDTTATNAGTVYEFSPSGARLAIIPPPDGLASQNFGNVLASNGSQLLVGATGHSVATFANAGAVYVIDGSANTATLTILNPAPAATDRFGLALAWYGSNILVGTPLDDVGTTTDVGSVTLLSGADGSVLKAFTNPSVVTNDQFGFAVAALGNAIVVGNPNHDSATNTDDGRVLVFAPPTAGPQTVSTSEDTPLPITLTGTDPDNDPLTFSIAAPPTHGTLSGTPPAVTYTPAADYDGADSFTFTVSDGAMPSPAATVSITVTPVNDPPLLTLTAVAATEDTDTPLTLTATDPDGTVVSFAVVTSPAHGVLAGTAPDLVYTPATHFHGQDTFSYSATDDVGASTTGQVTITVTPVNHPPVAADQDVGTAEDTPLPITLAASDVDGDTLTYTISTPPAHGTVSGAPPAVTYTPAQDYFGPDSFQFTATDPAGASAVGTVTVTVSPVNDPPVLTLTSITTDEDTSAPATLTATDVDGTVVSYLVVTSPVHGILTGIAPNLTYVPEANFHGTDAFVYSATDDSSATSTGTVNITVNSVDDPPVADAQSLSTAEDTPLPITLTASDVDGDPLTYTITTPPAHGVISGAPPLIVYTPAPNYNGADAFVFTATDPSQAQSSAMVQVTVTPVNDPPVLGLTSIVTAEDTPAPATLTASDVDGTIAGFAIVTPPAHGTLTGAIPDLTYVPAPNFNGADAFAYSATDDLGAVTTGTVTVTVTSVNDPPVLTLTSVDTAEDTPVGVTLSATDVDGTIASYAVVTPPAHGTFSGTAPSLTYTPAANFNGSDSFVYSATDDLGATTQGTVNIDVSSVNDAPVLTLASVTIDQDTPVAVTLTATDVDGTIVSIAVVTPPSHGTFSGTAPDLTYTPDAGYIGPDSFVYSATDDQAATTQRTVSITVRQTNTPPTLTLTAISTAEDTPVAVTLTATDSDGTIASFAVTTPPTHGTFTGTAPNLTYTPDANFHGADSFAYSATDNRDATTEGTVSIDVTSVNDLPVMTLAQVATDEDTAVAVTLTATDVDGTIVSFAIASPPSHGTFSGTAPNLTYTPSANYNGTDSFIYLATDNDGGVSQASVAITIRPVNDPPVAAAKTVTTAEDTAASITMSGSDVDGDALTFVVVTPPAHGTLSGAAPSLTYTPAANYHGGDSFTYDAFDGTVASSAATVTITVTPVNDAPVADAKTLSVNEDTPLAVTLTGSDVDGDAITFSVATQPQHGTLAGTPPSLTYTPGLNYNGADSFTYTSNDGQLASAAATVTITINPVNDPPLALAQHLSVVQGGSLNITLTGSDVDGDALTFHITNTPTGVLTGTPPALTYTPLAGFHGTDTFSFVANDGHIDSGAATITIDVATPVDAGTPDATTPDAHPGPHPDAGQPMNNDTGCGCTVGARGDRAAPAGLLLVLALTASTAAVRRRRRRTRRTS